MKCVLIFNFNHWFQCTLIRSHSLFDQLLYSNLSCRHEFRCLLGWVFYISYNWYYQQYEESYIILFLFVLYLFCVIANLFVFWKTYFKIFYTRSCVLGKLDKGSTDVPDNGEPTNQKQLSRHIWQDLHPGHLHHRGQLRRRLPRQHDRRDQDQTYACAVPRGRGTVLLSLPKSVPPSQRSHQLP